MVLICIFLMISNTEHLFILSVSHLYVFFEKMSTTFFPHFQLHFFAFLQLSCMHTVYIFYISPFSDIWFVMFSHFLGYLFDLLIFVFAVQKLFTLM